VPLLVLGFFCPICPNSQPLQVLCQVLLNRFINLSNARIYILSSFFHSTIYLLLKKRQCAGASHL
jgi:hypothetical protein